MLKSDARAQEKAVLHVVISDIYCYRDHSAKGSLCYYCSFSFEMETSKG